MIFQDQTRCIQVSRYWVVVLFVLMVASLVSADEGEEPEEQTAAQAYNQAIVNFNVNITSFPTWEAFQEAVNIHIEPGLAGRCFESTGSAISPVVITTVQIQRLTDEYEGWRKTRGNGWRQYKDRTFVEYRLNEKTRVLMRIEGVKPRFFFGYTRKFCEFPLGPAQEN